MNTPESWAIWDLRGLTLHAYHSGTDPESSDRQIRSPNHTLDKFVDRYLLPTTKMVPLNHIIAVGDAGKVYRVKLNPEYKATRKDPEPEIKAAMEASKNAIHELLHSVGIPQVTAAGTEADDVIAYLVENLPGHKYVYTVDADLIALASDNTDVFLKGVLTPVLQKDDIIVPPKHVTLFKSLVGDSSDNIKGVNGFGPAAWKKLVEAFDEDGLDELIDLIDNDDLAKIRNMAGDVNHPLFTKLADQAAEWRNSWQLVKLAPWLVDSKQGKEFTRLRWEKRLPSQERLNRLAMTTGAYWLIDDVKHLLPQQFLITKADWDENTLAEATELFKQSRFISIDWESWNPHQEYFKQADEKYVDMFGQIITGSGITCGENHEYTFYFQWDHADEHNNIDKQHLIELMDAIPEGMPIIAQNTLFERTVFMHEFGFDIPNLFDTKMMISHVDESMSSGLKDMSKQWLNYDQIKYTDVVEKGKTMKDYTGAHVFQYGADDPLVTAHLFDLFYIILNLEHTWEFVRDYEFPMAYVLSNAYLAGVTIDFDEVERQRAEDQETIDVNKGKLRQLLRLNVNEDTIYRGASNWVDELIVNKLADAKQALELIEKCAKSGDFYTAAKADKLLKPWLEPVMNESITPDEAKAEINRRVTILSEVKLDKEGARAQIWKDAKDASTYEEYVETPKPASFSWSQGKMNQIAEKLGFTAPAITDLDGWKALPPIDLVKSVIECIETAPAKKHTKTAGYNWLKDFYVANFEGSIDKSGTELNFDSPKQMSELLYAMLGLPIRLRALEPSESRQAKGLDGAPQTNEDAILMAIAVGDATGWKKEFLELMQDAKKAQTRIKFFYSKFPLWKHPIDGQVHPQFNSTGTETRRPTGSSPNMLQLSKKGDGVKVRKCFIPNKKLGHDVILTCDWDGEELRIMAGLSGDKALTSCYIGDNKRNVHSMTAAGIAGTSYDDFTAILKDKENLLYSKFSDLRKDSKAVNFLSAYGGGAAKLARKLLCPVETASDYLKAKKTTYAGIETWREEQIRMLHGQGYFRTLFGSRKHVFNKLVSGDEGLISYYERSSINFQIQGVAADYLKKVLADLNSSEAFQRHNAILLAAIYDELVVSIHSSQVVPFLKELYSAMTQGIPGLPIPMLCNPAVGINFADQVEILEDADDILTDEKILSALEKVLSKEIKFKEAA